MKRLVFNATEEYGERIDVQVLNADPMGFLGTLSIFRKQGPNGILKLLFDAGDGDVREVYLPDACLPVKWRSP